MGKCKFIANFSATMVTSLPSLSVSLSLSLSLSVSLSLSHRKYLTHNIGSASALPIIRPRPRLGGLAVACSLLADPGRRPCAIFFDVTLVCDSSPVARHECFTSDVGLTRTRLVSCILLTSLMAISCKTMHLVVV